MYKSFRSLVFPAFLLAVAGIAFLTTIYQSAVKPDSWLQIDAVPAGSAVQIDGHKASAGKNAVFAGTHTVAVSRSGFASKSQSIAVESEQTAYVGLALQPNSKNTANWYQQHEKDSRAAEAIGSNYSDYISQLAYKKMPVLSLLPVVYGNGHGGLVNIAQGLPVTVGGLPAVYITANSPDDRQSALTYIRSRGYDPAASDMVFTTQNNPLEPSNGQ